MKKSFLFSAALIAMVFASCSKETGVNNGKDLVGTDGIAYVSIKVEAQKTRAGESTEDDGLPAESVTNALYLITFTDAGDVVATPDGPYYTAISTTSKTPEAQKISAASKTLLVVANPGADLLGVITSLGLGDTYASFNAAIAGVTESEIVDATAGFAMISAGDDTNKAVGDVIADPLLTIGDKLKIVTDSQNADAEAKALAEGDRLDVTLERLAAKLIVKENPAGVVGVGVAVDADFTLTNWTVDAVNGTYYPFAEKTMMDWHTPGDYALAFYTRDPNYTGSTNIRYGTVDTDFLPVLPMGVWYAPETAIAYVIENTMAAASQTFANATRIVMKATYFPEDYTPGDDWFMFAGDTYASLADLQTAYAAVDATTALKNACEHFHGRLVAYNNTITAANFAALTQDDLDSVAPGGEVVKDGLTNVIRWYKSGVCYYYYEIRHDNDPDAGNLAFAKYGVVRNNWYNLTLNTVSAPGTPWYPDINNPGPGDPDPNDPIDKQAGYIGVSVEIAPWIVRDQGMDI